MSPRYSEITHPQGNCAISTSSMVGMYTPCCSALFQPARVFIYNSPFQRLISISQKLLKRPLIRLNHAMAVLCALFIILICVFFHLESIAVFGQWSRLEPLKD